MPLVCRLFILGPLMAVVCAVPTAALAAPRWEALPDRVREITRASLAQGDADWDERAGFVWAGKNARGSRTHGVRPTSWYALGLLLRNAAGDQARAERAFDAVLQQQIDAPGMPWDGTFYRRPEEQRPLNGAKMWDDYDPNWRQFVGCVLAQALIDFDERLSPALQERMLASIERALKGELAQGRLFPHYTNIALMQGFLLGFAGQRLHRPEWVTAAENWVQEIARSFAAHESFEEYNSPTYYGVDLYGLALLRAHGATPGLRAAGAAMEAGLWRDIGRFYHAELRTMAGPFDRTYGMDMREYVALTGLWMGFVLPPDKTPLPAKRPMAHGSDFYFVPCFALLGAEVPADVRAQLARFPGEHSLRRPIADGRRVVTAWLGSELMIGGQHTALSRGVPQGQSQFYPATIHWRQPDGHTGWIALRECSRVNASAEPGRLLIEATGDAVFRIEAAGLKPEQVDAGRWELPGLLVEIDSDARHCEVAIDDTGAKVTYREGTRFTLNCRH